MNWRNYRDLTIWMVAVVAIIGNAAVSHFNIDRMARLEQATLHARSVQLELTEILSDLKDAETGQRGYLLAGKDEYLQPYLKAEQSHAEHLNQARQLLAGDDVAEGRLAGVERLIEQKFAEMRDILAAYRTGGREAAVKLMTGGTGKQSMDELRAVVHEMLDAQEHTLDDRTRTASNNLYLARATGLIGAGIAVAVVLLATSLVQKELNRRLKANNELRESEGRFRNLAEAMPQIVWVTRPDGYHEYYNQRWYDFTGLTREQSLGWGWSTPLHRDDRERSQIRWKRSTDGGESYEIKYRFRRHDGEYRWFLGRAEPVRDARGAVVRWLGTCTDIDEQVRTAQSLQENEAYLRSVLDNSPDCVKILDNTGKMLDMNGPGLASMEIDDFGTVRGCPWPTLWPESLAAQVDNAIRVAVNGQVNRFSGACPTAKGTPKHWDVIVAPIPDSRGKVQKLVSVSRDVTEQKAIENALRESQRYVESVLHSLPNRLAVLEADGQIVTVNEAWKQYGEANGLPADFEWAGRNYFELTSDDEAGTQTAAGIQLVADGQTDRFQMDYPAPKGGLERYFHMRVNRFRGEGPLRLVVTHENITERVLADHRIQESASQLRQLTEGLPLLVWSCTAEGKCDYLSLQWVKYTGIGAEEQLGFEWLNALHPDDREAVAGAWRGAVEAQAEYEVEYRLRRSDGHYRWFAVRGIPVFDARGTVVRWYGSCTDIDDRKREAVTLEQLVAKRTTELTAAYEDLQETSALLKNSNEELEKFAYIASHDLQEPLRKIQAFGDRIAKKYADAIDETGQDYLARMLDSAGRMRRLIEDLLQFSRVSTKSAPHRPVSLNTIVQEVLSDLEMQIQRTHGHVQTGPLPTVLADVVQMRQVFQNLIGNALKFTRPQTPPVVTIDSQPTESGWRISVRDQGIGFEPEYADRIFELFQRLHGRKEFEGTGLGLAICKKIVNRHGATIYAESVPHEGTRFIIDWPTNPEGETSAPSPASTR
ncbi:PAS domain S-box protein [Limnoglobus roseus]|uniref:histidine kinase n=1 Tax=Limnoglobus roseus TaxID=2598579 RepID=A0A5C1AEN6_9BACT|nr:PAS domain S-box protein [Limnoglobus roseus]QEL16466.1 PAS domain S-box protein [Limnoglobus roseus]